jgi:transposase-like protein
VHTCKFCSSTSLVKNGKPKGVQRYLCKSCDHEQIIGDKRQKYDASLKRSAVILYLEGNGFRSIARSLSKIFNMKIYFQTVAKWIGRAGSIVEEEVASIRTENKEIEVVEMDELYTYIKKNKIESEYGLLLIGMNSVCLNLKSAMQKDRHG